MKLVFVTNVLNHHQAPLADEFYRLLGDDYIFVATSSAPSSKGGGDYYDRPYLLRASLDEESILRAKEVIDMADVVVIGASPRSLIRARVKHGALTFKYGERWLKRWYNILDYPRKFVEHMLCGGRELYFLAASGYMAGDLKLLSAYRNRCYKWGYFTRVEELNIYSIVVNREREIPKLMWCSRLLKWKHPELAIELARLLKRDGLLFELDIYGDGEELEPMKRLVKRLNLCDRVTFKGAQPNEQIRRAMRCHHIFLFTSDRAEGWGAVANEAMSNGCTIVSSDMVGAAPYLIEDRINGRLFRSGDLASLYVAVRELIDNPKQCREYAMRAYWSMQRVWSAESAARQFIRLAESLLLHEPVEIECGPCSRAD